MTLKDLLETLTDTTELDIYFDRYHEDYLLDYHYYGKNCYISKAYDLEFYQSHVKTVDFYLNHLNLPVIKVCCE